LHRRPGQLHRCWLHRCARSAHRPAHAQDLFQLPDQTKTKLYFTWRDKRGEQADVVTINFDSEAALAESEKKILEELWTAWIDFRDWNGARLVYFSHLITYRCAIKEMRYGYNGGPIDQVYKLPPCNILDANSVPEDAKIDMKIPPKTKSPG